MSPKIFLYIIGFGGVLLFVGMMVALYLVNKNEQSKRLRTSTKKQEDINYRPYFRDYISIP